MPFVRVVVLLLLLAGLACFALYFVTGQARYRAIGIRLIRWTVVAALVFFGVLIVERLAEMV
jgi:predicted ABC-type exoprotein transport system permease subunit